MIPFLIHGGHIRLLVPAEREGATKLAASLTLAGLSDREWHCVGWREYLASEDPAAPLVPGKRPKRARCMGGGGKLGKVLPNVPWSFQEHPIETQELIMLGSGGALKRRPSFAYGPRVQEVFAGAGVWTKAMTSAGIPANPPVELYTDPLRKTGKRKEFDLMDDQIAEHYLRAAQELPGPTVANVWEFGTPCTSYCDFNKINNGTRTFTEPRGVNPTKTEQEGNHFCDYTCRVCLELYNHDKEFILESSMPSGRYPKIWDQPGIQELQQSTGSLIVPTHLCEWGAHPVDKPGLRYKKGQWNLVTPGLYIHALLLARRCQGNHTHLEVEGESDIPGVPRTRQAQVYPTKLCKGWALVVQAAYNGWDSPRVAAALHNLDEGEQRVAQEDGRPPSQTKCGSLPESEFVDAAGLLQGIQTRCESIGESEFREGLHHIPPDEESDGEEEGAGEVEEYMVESADALQEQAEEEAVGPATDPTTEPEDDGTGMRLEPGMRDELWSQRVPSREAGAPPIDIFGPPMPRESPVGQTEDWWDLLEAQHCLVRHHVVRRRNFFGNHHGEWINCPVADNQIRRDRRTWMYPVIDNANNQGDRPRLHSRVFLDDWRSELDRLRNFPEAVEGEYAEWTGMTTFYLFDLDVDLSGNNDQMDCEEEDYGPEENLDEEWGTLPVHDEEGGALHYGLAGSRERARIFPTAREFNPSASSSSRDRSRSRSPPDGGDRRVGYLEASPRLEMEELGYAWNEDLDTERHFRLEEMKVGATLTAAAEEKALEYIKHCRAHPKYKPEVVRRAVEMGDELLEAAGSLEGAMEGLRRARESVIGRPTAGAGDPEVLAQLEEPHAAYIQEMNEVGIDTRRKYPPTRLKAEAYPSALEHVDEMFEKAWKDGHWGIVLFASDATEKFTPTLIECPQGRVPKQLPDRSISKEGRPIHAMMTANAATHKHQHPPAVQPRHRQIARKALWWSARNPGVRCLMAKLDVSRAFKWHTVDPKKCADFGSALPGKAVGIEGRVKMIYGGLPFGWSGAPGEYVAFALAGRAYHESFVPQEAQTNGPTPFSSEWLMDDGVIIEPLLGVRPWQAVDALGHAIKKIWGDAALNLEKQVEEGTPSVEQIVWGLHMNLDAMTIRLPEPKALKMRYLLALPELQPGGRLVKLRTAQELRGLGQYAAITMPALRTELSVIDAFLSPSKCEGGYIKPNVTEPEEAEIAWQGWDETLNLMRIWFEAPYEGSFESSLENLLSTRELLALPGREGRLRWLGGDATPTVAGTLDWKAKIYMREDAVSMLRALDRVPGLQGDVKVKIALAELICYVGFAASQGPNWPGEIVAYTTDNQNVRSWLTKRQTRCAVARHIIRILGMLEGRYGFRTLAFYIRTYHNVTADWISRETKKAVEDKMELDGWVKAEAQEDWEHYIQESIDGIYRWPGGDALGQSDTKMINPTVTYAAVEAKGVAVEIGRGRLPWAIAWQRLGGATKGIGGKPNRGEEAIEHLTLGSMEIVKVEEQITWAFASIAEDSWGGSRAMLTNFVRMYHPENVLVDFPLKGPYKETEEILKRLGYTCSMMQCRTTDYGDPVAKRKEILIAWDAGMEREPPLEVPRSAGEACSIYKTLEATGEVAPPRWLDESVEIRLNAKISTTGDRMLPWPAGHYAVDNEKQLLYDIRGPALTAKKGFDMVVIDHRGEKTQGRIIHPAEEWLLNGGRVEELRLLKENGTNEEELRRDAMRKCPQQTCHRVIAWLERWRQNPNLVQRVGVCRDRDRAAADAQVRAWMLAWKGNREHPQREYERWLKDRVGDCERVGGRPRGSKNRSKSAPPETLVHPVAIGRSREKICLDANRDLEKDIAWLDALAAEAVMSKLSEGTRAGYEIGWKQWCLWRRLEKKDIYLVGEGKEARKQDEDEQRLFAIKMGHLVAGHEDPTLHRRIWAALNGFKRWQPDTNRKYPVLPNMLRWMKHLRRMGTMEGSLSLRVPCQCRAELGHYAGSQGLQC